MDEAALDKLLGVLKSRKFWATIVGLVVLGLGERGDVSGEALLAAIGTIIAYIVGTGLEDTGKAAEKIKALNGNQEKK